MDMVHISVVVVTKNREKDLQECLGSLLCQSLAVDEIIVIDNNSTDNTREIVGFFSQSSKIPLRYFCENKKGYPFVRNLGLKKAKGEWVAFIDDDCVAHSTWYENIKLSVRKHFQAAAIVGQSETYFSKNIVSVLSFIVDSYWKLNRIEGNKILDYEILDTKNIVYNKVWLNKNKLQFNEKLAKYFLGTCEDIDLGLSLFAKGGVAFYSAKMRVFHKDPTDLKKFFSKYFYAKKAYDCNIWKKHKRKEILSFTKKERVRLYPLYKKLSHHLSFFQKNVLFLLLVAKVALDFLPLYRKKY